MSQKDDVEDAVYGRLYASCTTQMRMVHEAIIGQSGKGFDSDEECAAWAHEHILDLVVISRNTRQYYYLSHRGDILTKRAWMEAYCDDVLFVREAGTEDAPPSSHKWIPRGILYHDDARINGERADRDRKPLYHRDYFTPPGYYDAARGTFNIAKTQPIFAKATGRDTSHVYRFIEAIAGECTKHLLAWLRMKMINPTAKTQVVPVIVSRAQGTGKTTFAEVICKGLFGADNVLVTDQYDAGSRFNADYADALIVCHEEKEYEDKRNSTASLKSRATATTIRKESKGLDPIYQDSYTDFILTSNRDVPVKFEDDTDQRRFMVMEADETFTRKNSVTADEVFTKLYGADINQVRKGIPFVDDAELIAQFKHELYVNEELAATEVRKFPKTAAYERCFTMPRTTEATEIDSILRSLAPFIRASLDARKVVSSITLQPGEDAEETVELKSYLSVTAAMQWMPAGNDSPEYVALCRPLVFYDAQTNKPYSHATTERALYDANTWLMSEFGMRVYPVTTPLPGGFFGVHSRYRTAPTARFMLATPLTRKTTTTAAPIAQPTAATRVGERLRVNGQWRPDAAGEFETVNEMRPGVTTLTDKNRNVQYMDTFLFEADETTRNIYVIEDQRVKTALAMDGEVVLDADKLFAERLRLQMHEATRLFNEGKVARVVYSGGKSYHMIVRVLDAPTTIEEYRWVHASLCLSLSDKLTFDASTADPARLTRAPITHERTFTHNGAHVRGEQHLVHEDWTHVYNYEWRALYVQWLNRPMADYERAKNKRMMPMKQEYRDAMSALLHGTFWSDPQWNGRRQSCFFPAYRLCRVLGYSHEQLWADDGILDGLNAYYRRNEIEYWRNRENSDLVRRIDRDVEEAERDAHN